MEDLFSTNISVNNQNIIYRVIFDNDKYVFLSESDQHQFPSFSFRREHDEWLDQELLPPETLNYSRVLDRIESRMIIFSIHLEG